MGIRRPEDEEALRQKSTDPALVLDRVSPSIEGYFRLPAVWIGNEPIQETILKLNEQVHDEFVLTTKLECGIETRVQRDGTFWFDFTTWPFAPQVEIPGYRIPDPKEPYRPSHSHIKAVKQAEDNAVLRAKVMNVHQACLTSSETIVANRSAAMGYPVTAWNTEKAFCWFGLRNYSDDTEDLHALARNLLNNSYGIHRDQPLSRRVIELEVVEQSLSMLDRILSLEDTGLLELVETIFIAACRNRDKRFGEALTLSWSVCEQIVYQIWKNFLNEGAEQHTSNRISKERRKKLTGRDYTASIVVEFLELIGVLDKQTYQNLNRCRRSRNKWAHELDAPNEDEANTCIRTAQDLLLQHFGVQFYLQPGGRGGVPMLNRWVYDQIVQNERTPR